MGATCAVRADADGSSHRLGHVKALIPPVRSAGRMIRIRRLAVVAAILVTLAVLAGCLGGPTQSGSAAPTTAEPSGEVLVVSKANQTRARAQPASRKARFDELSADRRDEFLGALSEDVREPSQWGPGTDVQYVRYEGTWYFVTVVIEN